MKKYSVVVLIPVGPFVNLNFLRDTIESIETHFSKPFKLVLVDDSQRNISEYALGGAIDIIRTPHNMGKNSGLYFSLCLGLRHIISKYKFDVVLRLDEDAIIIGDDPGADAITYFNLNPNVGIIGSYNLAWDGFPRSFEWGKEIILKETSILGRILNILCIRKCGNYSGFLEKAIRNNYKLGEHVLGGAVFFSYKLINELNDKKFLPSKAFEGSKLQEDYIFGILTKAVGMELGDFVTGNYPMCIAWKGLPVHPRILLSMKKKITHSTKSYLNMSEQDIREIFSNARKFKRKK